MTKSLKLITTLLSLLLLFTIAANAQQNNAANNNIHYITDTTCNFKGLINKFKGKVIYINIWATWCHPCRMDLQSKKDVKPFAAFAAKNDIVVLYICGDKNGKAWKGFITANQLVGYHILMNKHVDVDMHTTFGVYQPREGGKMKKSLYLPRHMIIDQHGAVTDSATYQEGSPLLYARLNKIISK